VLILNHTSQEQFTFSESCPITGAGCINIWHLQQASDNQNINILLKTIFVLF